MVLNHFKELLRPRLDSRVGHEHDFHQLGHQVRVADVVLVAQHHDEEHHDILSAGLVQHLRRVSGGQGGGERGEAPSLALGGRWCPREGRRPTGPGAGMLSPLQFAELMVTVYVITRHI